MIGSKTPDLKIIDQIVSLLILILIRSLHKKTTYKGNRLSIKVKTPCACQKLSICGTKYAINSTVKPWNIAAKYKNGHRPPCFNAKVKSLNFAVVFKYSQIFTVEEHDDCTNYEDSLTKNVALMGLPYICRCIVSHEPIQEL